MYVQCTRYTVFVLPIQNGNLHLYTKKSSVLMHKVNISSHVTELCNTCSFTHHLTEVTTKEHKLLQLGSLTSSKKEIGKGSFGRVFVGTTLCAIKEIHPILVNDCNPNEFDTLIKKFLNECLHCSQLCHPNISS